MNVSVIMTTCNRSQFVQAAIDSVLAQSFKDFEIIVIDDGSKIPVSETLRNYFGHIRVVRNKYNLGVSCSRNIGIAAASGELIAQLDDDDLWMPDYLEKNVQIFNQYPEVAMVGSLMDDMDSQGNIIKEGIHKGPVGRYTLTDIFHHSWPRPSAVVIRKKCLDNVNGYDESFKGYEDADLYFRIAAKYPCYFLNERLVKYRVHGASASSKELMMGLDGIRAWERFRTFKPTDISNKQIDRRISRQHYRVAREYAKEESWNKAFKHLSKAVLKWPLVGLCFVNKSDSLFDRTKKVVIPFLAFAGLYMATTPLKPLFQRWMKPRRGDVGDYQ